MINYHPKPGQILLCDFSIGFEKPEMVKANRPVVVLSGSIQGRDNLVTITPISSTSPEPKQLYHYKLPKHAMPQLGKFQEKDSWVKADMLYTVGFHRLSLIRLGKRDSRGKREYFLRRLGREQMQQIYRCALHGLNLRQLAQHV